MPSLYMINPAPSGLRPDTWPGWVSSPDLAIVTVAAMAPAHWRVQVTEEAVQPVDLDSDAKFIGLTGKSSQLEGIARLSRHFRRRGATVLVGGPLASLDPDAVREHADILFTGEMEDIAPELFADLERGVWKDAYDGGRADITRSPLPRWDLYPVQRSMSGALQTTRGCPFECDFCDVIVYQGRKQRHKTLDQVLSELDALHAAGFSEVFLSDDNFAVHRKHARGVLQALADWNARHEAPMRFFTQTSLDLAREPELMALCHAAGLRRLFVGVESANEASLRETRKRQNLLMPIVQATERMVEHGLTIRAGLICGFDNDGPDIFAASYDFFQDTPLPELVVSMLQPTIGTPLHLRLGREGRLLGDGRWTEFRGDACGFRPKLMSPEELVEGVRDLAGALYGAEAFERRMLRVIELLPPDEEDPRRAGPPSERGRAVTALIGRIPRRGRPEKRMLARVLEAANEKPGALRPTLASLSYFEMQRHVSDQHEAAGRLVGTMAANAMIGASTLNAAKRP